MIIERRYGLGEGEPRMELPRHVFPPLPKRATLKTAARLIRSMIAWTDEMDESDRDRSREPGSGSPGILFNESVHCGSCGGEFDTISETSAAGAVLAGMWGITSETLCSLDDSWWDGYADYIDVFSVFGYFARVELGCGCGVTKLVEPDDDDDEIKDDLMDVLDHLQDEHGWDREKCATWLETARRQAGRRGCTLIGAPR